jgi:hypothetical protein
VSIRGAIFGRLSAWPALVDLVGSRVWPNVLPEDPDFPAVVYQRISTARVHTHDSAGGLATTRIQFTCYGTSGDQAEEVADQVRAALDGLRGTFSGTRIDAALSQNELSGLDPVRKDVHREVLDITFTHAE